MARYYSVSKNDVAECPTKAVDVQNRRKDTGSIKFREISQARINISISVNQICFLRSAFKFQTMKQYYQLHWVQRRMISVDIFSYF